MPSPNSELHIQFRSLLDIYFSSHFQEGLDTKKDCMILLKDVLNPQLIISLEPTQNERRFPLIQGKDDILLQVVGNFSSFLAKNSTLTSSLVVFRSYNSLTCQWFNLISKQVVKALLVFQQIWYVFKFPLAFLLLARLMQSKATKRIPQIQIKFKVLTKPRKTKVSKH